MKKKISPKQIEANRNNAQKSTGPQTTEGKAASKMNAIKHGILAREVVVRGTRIQENVAEYQALHAQLWQDVIPVGFLEEMLVEQIVASRWRLRRALAAENGEIRLSVDHGSWERQESRRKQVEVDSKAGVLELLSSVAGIDCAIHALQDLRERINQEGDLSDDAFDDFRAAFSCNANGLTLTVEKVRDECEDNSEGLTLSDLKARNQQRMLACIAGLLAICEHKRPGPVLHETQEEAARQTAGVLPPASALDKILRYETTLERQLYRAMNQLERLQRRRQGEAVPPPISMEVAHQS